jgi:cytochrome b-561
MSEHQGWWEQRLGLRAFRKKFLNKAFPAHPTFFLGEIALFSFIILVITGIYLAFSYEPSAQEVVINGLSAPTAYHSVLQIDHQPFGSVVRQVHHWSAHILIASAILHLLRVFFSGTFRKPREINWVIGSFLLLISVVAAFSGYLLPYDEFAVTATGIGYGIARSIPWIGPEIANFVFAGDFPALETVPRFYGYHTIMFPLLIAGLLGLHLLVMFRQKHSEPSYNQGKVAEGKLMGIPLWPHQSLLMAQLFLLLIGGVLLLSSVFPVHPVELYGPPSPETPSVKPDWYFLWVYGALKLVPGWIEIHLFGGVINAEAIGGIIFPGIVIMIMILWPFLERSRVTINYMQTLREAASRTSIGVGVLVMLLVFSLAGYEDTLNIPLDVFRWGALIAPLLSGAGTYLICKRKAREFTG